jgi:D-xylose transport system ATP-binding protein
VAVPPPLLVLRGVCKRFGAVRALVDVELKIRAGEVVALVGENAAGKSTLVKVISGVTTADRGSITWQGRPVQIRRPHDAQDLGIATVYQDLAMCGNLDVVGNLFLGREIHRAGLLDEVEMERRTRDQLNALSLGVPDVRAPVASLSGGQRQTVAISRSLLGKPKLLLLDEPTASLGVDQANRLLDLIEKLRDGGLGVLLISHNMGDIKAIADQVAVLRLGRNNGFFDVNTTPQEQITSAVIGASDNAVAHRTTTRDEAWP